MSGECWEGKWRNYGLCQQNKSIFPLSLPSVSQVDRDYLGILTWWLSIPTLSDLFPHSFLALNISLICLLLFCMEYLSRLLFSVNIYVYIYAASNRSNDGFYFIEVELVRTRWRKKLELIFLLSSNFKLKNYHFCAIASFPKVPVPNISLPLRKRIFSECCVDDPWNGYDHRSSISMEKNIAHPRTIRWMSAGYLRDGIWIFPPGLYQAVPTNCYINLLCPATVHYGSIISWM